MPATTRNFVISQLVWRGEISTALSTLVHKRQVGHRATPTPKDCRFAQEPSPRNGATGRCEGTPRRYITRTRYTTELRQPFWSGHFLRHWQGTFQVRHTWS